MKLLLVEDDRMHATFLSDLVETALPEVTEVIHAQDGYQGARLARENQIEAIVMDLRMKERNGIDAARTIWAERPMTRILFWSNYSDDAYLRGISRIVPEDAAYGYILKTATLERTHLALRSVLIESQIFVDKKIHRVQKSHGNIRNLNESEREVLLDISTGLTDKIIAKRRRLSLRTVQNRLISLYEKLEINSKSEDDTDLSLNKRTRAIATAVRTGLINVDDLTKAELDFSSWMSQRAARTD